MTYITLDGLSKAFGPTHALTDVSMGVEAGSVHGLLGENGAGKSTLVKSLSGIVTPDAGRIMVDGEEIPFGSPAGARRYGISTAFQELSLLPNLTVGENLLLEKLPRNLVGMVSPMKTRSRALATLERWGIDDVDPSLEVGQLTLAQRQRVELVRALDAEPKLLILDEPTAAIPDPEWLFEHIHGVTARGGAVLYISHRMPEIERICDEGTVLRNGRVVADFTRETFNENEIITKMIGRSLNLAFPERTKGRSFGKAVLSTRDLQVGNELMGVDLDVHEGEVVGLAGLEGQGQRELLYALAGLAPITGGTVEVDGKPVKLHGPRSALTAGSGVALVPEERKSEGLFLDLTVKRNITLPALGKFSPGGFVSPAGEWNTAAQVAEEVNIDRRVINRSVASLSGGNQQKVVLGRTMLTGAKCLLLFDPTRGIDAGTKLEVYEQIRNFSAEGGAVLLYSTEIPELVGLSDRVHVLYRGQMVLTLAGDSLTEEGILSAAVGQKLTAVGASDTSNQPAPGGVAEGE